MRDESWQIYLQTYNMSQYVVISPTARIDLSTVLVILYIRQNHSENSPDVITEQQVIG
jgi:hypothetical protein